MGKEPSFQYYPKDWRADAVFGCSIGARGLWHEMMNMMHASERYGYLSSNGLPIPDEQIARYCGVTLQEYQTLLAELERAGVPRRTSNDILFSKRMVEDAKQRSDWRKQKKNQRDSKVSAPCPPDVRTMSAPSPLPSPSPPSKKEEERENLPPAKPAGVKPTAEFLAFWGNYPRKIDKQDAIKAWIRRGCEGRLGEVLASLKAWIEVEWKGREREFIPHAATWLNGDCWKETPEPPAKVTSLEDQLKAWEATHGSGSKPHAN